MIYKYDAPLCLQITGLIVDDLGHMDRYYDIIIEHRMEYLKCINDLHPIFIGMQYPALFAYSNDDFRVDIKYKNDLHKPQMNEQYVIMSEFYAYRLQQRMNKRRTLIRGERLFQLYIVDDF